MKSSRGCAVPPKQPGIPNWESATSKTKTVSVKCKKEDENKDKEEEEDEDMMYEGEDIDEEKLQDTRKYGDKNEDEYDYLLQEQLLRG